MKLALIKQVKCQTQINFLSWAGRVITGGSSPQQVGSKLAVFLIRLPTISPTTNLQLQSPSWLDPGGLYLGAPKSSQKASKQVSKPDSKPASQPASKLKYATSSQVSCIYISDNNDMLWLPHCGSVPIVSGQCIDSLILVYLYGLCTK